MLPSAYEFHWDLGHLIFLGVFYGVLATVITALGVTIYRWWGDLRGRRVAAIEMEEAFHELPRERRHCRHEFDGSLPSRICDHEFDCATCAQHRALVAAGLPAGAGGPSPVGMNLDADRFYHRGHTWVQPCPDGTLQVGLDEFARRCFGPPARVELPAVGRTLAAGERGVILERGPLRARVSAPVSGEVVAQGGRGGDWLYRLRPTDAATATANLLQGDEARVWMLRELDWLQGLLSTRGNIPSLADGGAPVDDLVQACPDADWDSIWGQVCLEA